jgi:hypothetical protein
LTNWNAGGGCYVDVMTRPDCEYGEIEIEGDGVLCCLRKIPAYTASTPSATLSYTVRRI